MANVYCPFCGVILLNSQQLDQGARSIARPWYAEVRGIYSTNSADGDITGIHLTGLGIILGQDFYAPVDSHLSYLDRRVEARGIWGVCSPSEDGWCFGFHDSCWRLLLSRLGHEQNQSEATIVESVFYQLFCTPCLEDFSFQFGHDYGGAAQFQASHRRHRSEDSRLQLYADPCATPSLDDLEANASGPFVFDGNRHSQPPMHYVFDKLSVELKLEIFSYLSFGDLLNTRLVCRGLLATADSLPQSYWRSKFLLGQEADFLFLKLTGTRDWSRVFLGIRAYLRAGILPLINRKRIRQLIEPIAALVELHAVFGNEPYGDTLDPAQNMEIAGNFSGQLANIGADDPLIEGCRALCLRTQSLVPPNQQYWQRIGISTVRIGARSFISGINLISSVEYMVGYRNPHSEKLIEVPPASHVKALNVAFCPEGLMGIEIVFTDLDSSGWVGVNTGRGLACGVLSIPEQRGCLLAALDKFKIVGLEIGELTEHTGASQSRFDLVQSHLWRQDPPTHVDLSISDLLPSRSRAFEPLTNIDFGGPGGLFLASLTRLTFHMASPPGPLIGMEAFYRDGRSVLSGASGGCALSLFVDGLQGERINGIGTIDERLRYESEIDLGGLQVSTNYGRTATFADILNRHNATAAPIPISPSGNTITGLVAVETDDQSRFARIGIQSQPCEEQPTIPRFSDRECHEIPDDQLLYGEVISHHLHRIDMGNYQTYASLKNVRKIYASTGIHGRCRSPDCISGLKFEYYTHPSPGSVGQWMNGLDGGFELSPDEKIASLATWLTPVHTVFFQGQNVELGQVCAVQITTTYSRSVTFRSPGFDSLPPRKLHNQYRADSNERLTAISWMMDTACESVRAVVTPTATRRLQILVPEGRPPPFDQVQKLYFEGPHHDTLASAEAYFRDRAIIGLRFIYSSGSSANMGDLDTPSRETVHFARDTRITGLSTAVSERDIVALGLETERGEKVKLAASSTPSPSGTVEDWRYFWCTDDSSADRCRRILQRRDRIYRPPGEPKLVGIYVGCREFRDFGAVYEPKPLRANTMSIDYLLS